MGARSVAWVALMPACSLVADLGSLQGASMDAAMEGATGDAGDAGADTGLDGACPTGLPVMVQTPLGFCIDSTEVTRAQYGDFLNSGPLLSDQPAVCAANGSFIPSANWPDTSSLPVVNVNWCDAYAYCKWAGKRLCGAIGGSSLATTNLNNAAQDQWFAACTRGGTRVYPYGSTYDASACNGSDRNVGGPVPVASQPGCVGGYPGIFDMSGNVWEWRDSCAKGTGGPSTDICAAAGGGYYFVASLGDASVQMECQAYGLETRISDYADRGFRCCAP